VSKVKETYRQFCETSTSPLIFQTPLWLDAVVGDNNWEVILSFKGNVIVGAMPYVTSQKFGLQQITLPLLTFYMGPIINLPSDLSAENKLSFKRKVITDIVSKIPKTDRFVTQTDFEFDYWLPFYWKGFEQTTRYTYTLSTGSELDDIFNSFKPSIKKTIKKSEPNFNIQYGENADLVYGLYETDYKRKNLETSFSKSDIDRIDKALEPTENRIIIEATDENNTVIAAYYLLLDKTYLHYIFGAVDEKYRDSGVMSLIMWKAIQEAKSRGLNFNFGGSMNKNIEQFFSGFRGNLTPYMRISKVSNKWLKHFTRFNPK